MSIPLGYNLQNIPSFDLMGGVGDALGAVANVMLFGRRSIMGVIPSVTIEEAHTDALQITQHPVIQGAAISDHAYALPKELRMKVGWTNCGTNKQWRIGEMMGYVLGSEVNAVYQALLVLQSSRIPLMINTGKRFYRNMLIKSLSTTTNIETENALILDCVFQEIIIVSTEIISLPSDTQSSPSATASPANIGSVQPVAQNGTPTGI